MRRPVLRLGAVALSTVALAGCAKSSSVATKTLMDFQTTQNGQTEPFQTPSKWDLVYSWDCSEQKAQGHTSANHFSFILYNADDMSTAAEDQAEVNKTGASGSGTIHYKRSGIYVLSINSECKYRIRALNPNA